MEIQPSIPVCDLCGLPHGTHIELCESDLSMEELKQRLNSGTLLVSQDKVLWDAVVDPLLFALQGVVTEARNLRWYSWPSTKRSIRSMYQSLLDIIINTLKDHKAIPVTHRLRLENAVARAVETYRRTFY